MEKDALLHYLKTRHTGYINAASSRYLEAVFRVGGKPIRKAVNGERPGEFKKHDYVTGIHEVGSASEDVESELTELIDEVNSYGGADALKAGAYLHARFEYIHPFAAGNGRVGRTLLNYFFMIHDHPPLVVYDEDKTEYYAALQGYDENEDIDALIVFVQMQAAKTWAKSISLAEGEPPQQRKSLSDFAQEMN